MVRRIAAEGSCGRTKKGLAGSSGARSGRRVAPEAEADG